MSERSTERGVFDLRLHVTGEDKFAVWEQVTAFQRAAQLLASPAVEVKYVQLRRSRSPNFEATMAPAQKKRKAA